MYLQLALDTFVKVIWSLWWDVSTRKCQHVEDLLHLMIQFAIRVWRNGNLAVDKIIASNMSTYQHQRPLELPILLKCQPVRGAAEEAGPRISSFANQMMRFGMKNEARCALASWRKMIDRQQPLSVCQPEKWRVNPAHNLKRALSMHTIGAYLIKANVHVWNLG